MQKDRKTILIVDDASENIDVLRGILKDQYKIKASNNGARALDIAFATQPPDLILLDVMMPDMDGYEVCQRLKDDPRTARIPIIFVTAMTDTADEVKGLELGAVDYLTKPVNPPIVRARVKTHITLSQQSRLLKDIINQCTRELHVIREFIDQDEVAES